MHTLPSPPRRTSVRSLGPRLALPLLLLAGGACQDGATPALDGAGSVEAVELTIRELHSALANRRTRCRAVIQAHLDRIHAYDESSGLHAVTEINPNALTTADSIDAALAAGAPMGAMACVPVLVKDNFNTHDLPTTGGSVALLGNIPPTDAFMVRRLREEGAVILAKTNMAEWAFSPRQTISSSYGTTANAYDLARVPAGSSGGSASGVAAAFGVVGLGSDTGNSIRGPASHLALVGIRSTLGLTSRSGVIPLSFDRDVAGPLTRTVEDAARVFNVVAGTDPEDPYTDLGGHLREADYTSFLVPDALESRKVGVIRRFADPSTADPEVLQRFQEALEVLAEQGADIMDPFPLPELDAWLSQATFCRRFRYDVHQYLLSLGSDAPILDPLTVLETGDFGSDAEAGLRSFGEGPLNVHPAQADPPCLDFAQHPGRQRLLNNVIMAMDEAGLDALVFPTWSHPPAPLDRGNEEYRGDNSQGLVPSAGLPAITVPMGFTQGTLPAGLQFAGRPYSEGLLFGLAFAYEQATLHRRPPSAFPPLP
ncbi:MAG: amidase family protein [Gemmatimonadota bacterium]